MNENSTFWTGDDISTFFSLLYCEAKISVAGTDRPAVELLQKMWAVHPLSPLSPSPQPLSKLEQGKNWTLSTDIYGTELDKYHRYEEFTGEAWFCVWISAHEGGMAGVGCVVRNCGAPAGQFNACSGGLSCPHYFHIGCTKSKMIPWISLQYYCGGWLVPYHHKMNESQEGKVRALDL